MPSPGIKAVEVQDGTGKLPIRLTGKFPALLLLEKQMARRYLSDGYNGAGTSHISNIGVRTDHASGCLVGSAAARFSWAGAFCRLLYLGGFSGESLLLWPVSVSFLFAGTFWRFTT